MENNQNLEDLKFFDGDLDELKTFNESFNNLVRTIETWKLNQEKRTENSKHEIIDYFHDFFRNEFTKKDENLNKKLDAHLFQLEEQINKVIDKKFQQILSQNENELKKMMEELYIELQSQITDKLNKVVQEKSEQLNPILNEIKSLKNELLAIQTNFASLQRDYIMFNKQISTSIENHLTPISLIERIAKLEGIVSEHSKIILNNKSKTTKTTRQTTKTK